MLKVVTLGVVAFLAAQIPLSAQASTVTFDLTLTNSISGPTNGTGQLIVDGPLSSGVETLSSNTGGGLDYLSIQINSEDFLLQDALGTTTATFNDGNLTNLGYVGTMDGYRLDLATSGLFYLYIDANNWTLSSEGTISAVDPPSPAPLPASSILFATGLLGLGLLTTYRRKVRPRPAIA